MFFSDDHDNIMNLLLAHHISSTQAQMSPILSGLFCGNNYQDVIHISDAKHSYYFFIQQYFILIKEGRKL